MKYRITLVDGHEVITEQDENFLEKIDFSISTLAFFNARFNMKNIIKVEIVK